MINRLFGTDGIRGEANRPPMDAMTAFSVGQALTYILKKQGHKTHIIIGKDTRISGYMVESSLEAGITSMGGNPYLVGVLPTPGISFITQSMRADAGIMVSASHNSYQDNGIKIFSGDGYKLSDDMERMIEMLVHEASLPEKVPLPREMGQAKRLSDVFGRYIVFLKSSFPRNLSMEGLKVVIDASNGATYKIAPDTFQELGAYVEVINNKPNGININEKCGSQHIQNLAKRVIDRGASVGLAFDGDGDRLIAVDEKGKKITGDQILIICSKMLKEQGRLNNNLVVSTVMSNLGLQIACRRLGFVNHSSQVGDRYVLEDMLRLGAVIGGEDSGHTIFLDHHTTGDGILTGLQLIAAMMTSGKPLSELAQLMDIYPQKLVNIKVNKKPLITTVPQIMDAITQAEKDLGDEGRVLVRYSGTRDVCRVMVEGPTNELTETICGQIADVVMAALG
ncbi:MAG: phosphoglucosamine mutase [Pseudomonadota bacterium]